MGEMDELVTEFLVESYDNLDQLDRDFVALEQDPTNKDTLAQIFRYIHTIKGTCGFLGFDKLEGLTHVGENLLSKLRDGELTLTLDMTNALLEMVDGVREILGSIETTGEEGDGDYTQLIATLTALLDGGAAPVVAEEAPVAEAESEPAPSEAADVPEEERPAWMASDDVIAEAEAFFNGEESPAEDVAPAEAADVPEEERPAWMASDDVIAEAEAFFNGEEAPAQAEVPATEPEPDPTPEAKPAQAETPRAAGGAVSDATIRVDVMLLDRLMNLVGELVLSRNQIIQISTAQEDPAFLQASQRLNLVTSELQEGVMKTRMQPIKNVWSKFPRVVRDLSRTLGKQIRLEMEGEDTELDKTLLEAIKDPLTHMVRNSVDHGVEMPADRAAKGKPEEGRLLLKAFHEGGQVVIEITDDGGGIDAQKMKAKALEKGVITQKQASAMSDRELQNLIWGAGFSTAKEVTNISGRGVGMDVVRTNIEKIGGSVDLNSELGVGSTFRIKIPLTLAIIPALIVRCRDSRYAIPQVSLTELVRLEAGDLESSIEHIHGSPVYRLRGRLLPLVYLEDQLFPDKERDPKNEEDGLVDDSVNIAVLQADSQQFGLVVDSVRDTEEIVVKPLGKQLKDLTVFAGATIMGDGKVVLILDTMGIAHSAGIIGAGAELGASEPEEEAVDDNAGQRMSVLLFSSDGSRIAIPLSLVSRLEEFPASSVERSGASEVVQYRGQILPLVRVSDSLTDRRSKPREGEDLPPKDEDQLQVVVYGDDGHCVGIVVDQILDITEETITARGRASREGVMFTAVIQGNVTEFLDIEHIIRQAIPEFFDEEVWAAAESGV